MQETFQNSFGHYNQPFPAGVKLPQTEIPKSYLDELNLPDDCSNFNFVKTKSEFFLENYIKDKENKNEYKNRLQYELELLDELGFIDYVLLNWDILNFCHENNIPIGRGRGSASGSLLLFCLGITKIDPIRHNLIFERFVSRSRAKKIELNGETFLDGSLLCDVDNDISYDRRHEVIQYIDKKFSGYTCKILTLNTLSSKLCIKECVKLVGEMSEEKANQISSLIPKDFGTVYELEKAIESSDKLREFLEEHPKILEIAKKIEGLNKNTGVHPSGIAISYYPIKDIMPIQLTNDGNLVSGYDMDGVASLMVKFDILGLRTLSVVNNTCQQIGIDMDSIDYENNDALLKNKSLETPKGIFQIEADTQFGAFQKMQPNSFSELSDLMALARPGALQYVDEYCEVKRGNRELEKIHPIWDEIVKDTKGFILYQEQQMQIANKVFGFDLSDAESLRKVIGKKKIKEMPAWKEKVYEKAAENNLPESLAEKFWDSLNASANYSFNKSHACSYGSLASITLQLKHKYPKEFFLSLLKMALHEPDPLNEIGSISKELPHYGISLLPPDLSKSNIDFSIEGDNIRYGLNAIKGISEKSLQNLIDFRGQSFENIYDVFLTAKDCGLNIGILCSLIQAGALDSMTDSRTKTVLHACSFNLLTDRVKRNVIKMGPEHNYDVLNTIHYCVKNEIVGDDKRKIFTEKTFETFKKRYAKYKEIYNLNRKHEKFANWYFEYKTLGYSYTYRLKDTFEQKSFTDIYSAKRRDSRSSVNIIGVVDDYMSGISRANNKYLRINISDELDSVTGLLMDNSRKTSLSEFYNSGGKNPEKGSIVSAVGNMVDGTFFIDSLNVLDKVIYLKLGELK